MSSEKNITVLSVDAPAFALLEEQHPNINACQTNGSTMVEIACVSNVMMDDYSTIAPHVFAGSFLGLVLVAVVIVGFLSRTQEKESHA
jgi:hypothetical protein